MGISPFMALYGREPRLPCDPQIPDDLQNLSINDYEQQVKERIGFIHMVAENNMIAKRKEMELRYNKNHRLYTYEIGEQVLLKRMYKDHADLSIGLSSTYIGPFEIVYTLDTSFFS
ncbi:hypothetical protein AYI70_g989 [Smittium culicis]|uniref:Uncharacterized protein n=1 Tax=Smittium culicis TaxID=133412 RepID=A0A1R1YEG0_9FUNG|nr:hypothetical protein AYI70_g989 [Smittium culicis]